jgi:hypothetical protein
MHPSTPPADRAIYEACARLEKLVAMHAAIVGLTTGPLPIAEAEALMGDVKDDNRRSGIKYKRALEITLRAVEHIREANEVAYARTHGLFALDAANDNRSGEAA